MSEERDVVGRLSDGAIDNSPRAFSCLIQRFSAYHRRSPHRPFRVLRANLGSRAALVDTVIPLAKILVDFRQIRKSCQATRFAGAFERTRKHDQLSAAQRLSDEFGL